MNYSGLYRLDEEETPVDEQPTMEVKPSQLPPAAAAAAASLFDRL